MIVYLHWIDEAIKEVPKECLVKNGLSNTVIRAKIQPLFTFRFLVTVEFKMSFEQLRTALAIAFADGLLNEEKFLILYNEYEPIVLAFSIALLLVNVNRFSGWQRKIFQFWSTIYTFLITSCVPRELLQWCRRAICTIEEIVLSM